MKVFHPDDHVMEKWPRIWRLGNLLRRKCVSAVLTGISWFLLRAVPRRDERGNIVKWYGTSSDIEDLKRRKIAFA